MTLTAKLSDKIAAADQEDLYRDVEMPLIEVLAFGVVDWERCRGPGRPLGGSVAEYIAVTCSSLLSERLKVR